MPHLRRKQESQTHVEFAHEKEVYFDRWCYSREVGTDFEKLTVIIQFTSKKMSFKLYFKCCIKFSCIE